MKHGKKYTDSRKLVDSTKLYEPAEAMDLIVTNRSRQVR